MTRAELNKAIFTVLRTQYKKDAPDAFKAVEANGYKITKWNGSFGIEADNGKCVHLEWNTWSNKFRIQTCYSYNLHLQTHWFNGSESTCPVDFVGYFESPIKKRENPYHAFYRYNHVECGKALQTYYKKIASVKDDIRNEEKWIADRKKQIANLQKEIEKYNEDIHRHYKEISKKENELNNNRFAIGLVDYVGT